MTENDPQRSLSVEEDFRLLRILKEEFSKELEKKAHNFRVYITSIMICFAFLIAAEYFKK